MSLLSPPEPQLPVILQVLKSFFTPALSAHPEYGWSIPKPGAKNTPDSSLRGLGGYRGEAEGQCVGLSQRALHRKSVAARDLRAPSCWLCGGPSLS